MRAEFVDTNIVIYSFDDNPVKRLKALAILARRPVISVQVLNETANTLRRKLAFDIPEIRRVLIKLMQESHIHPLTPSTIFMALNIEERYRYSHYDSVIVATALEAGCSTLHSEDMQHGRVIEGRLQVVNPFL